MSTPDQPSAPPLTRRQLRELRNTASNPVITPEEAEAAAGAAAESPAPPTPPAVQLPRAAEPVHLPDAPSADIDLDEHPVTRRQARHQARLRTASVDIITDADEHEAAQHHADEHDADEHGADQLGAEQHDAGEHDADELGAEQHDADEHGPGEHDGDADDADHDGATVEDDHGEVDGPAVAETEAESADADGPADQQAPVLGSEARSSDDQPAAAAASEEREQDAPVVAPALGAHLLAGEPGDVELPASFDQLLSRGTGGSSSAPNALILSQTPDTGSLSVPILGTGELIITGSYSLPESYGSTGTTPGTSDGKDIDASLIDGELPPASSPTPIAASSAVSTIKSADEIIRPPAPEKGSRLIMTLAICAGALGLALATVLILAVVNGVF